MTAQAFAGTGGSGADGSVPLGSSFLHRFEWAQDIGLGNFGQDHRVIPPLGLQNRLPCEQNTSALMQQCSLMGCQKKSNRSSGR